jgi:hypothetical protein
METRKIKRRKPPAQRKESVIPVRVTKEQKAALTAKAARLGMGVSSWLLMLGMSAGEASPSSGD